MSSLNNLYINNLYLEGNKQTIRVREELAICFQHEMDHLNGILFTDKIDSKNPFKGKDTYRAI